ncbi:MAG: hypothetical protein V7L05_04685 [Nostoc sp.]|uniref:hypothetical protein n=1 Tax=Nostoc sp. TaxID=1180 RepID=UPI002FFC7448
MGVASRKHRQYNKGDRQCSKGDRRYNKGDRQCSKRDRRYNKGDRQGLCRLVPSLEAGNEFREALPLVKLLEAEPPRMGSQPGGWEPVRAGAVT